jgi:hypothetical protein
LKPPETPQNPFRTFFMAGFECSTHRTEDGRRLDLVSSTRHDLHAMQDYARLRGVGIGVAREGLRWHLIASRPGQLDFTTVEPILDAARAHDVQVIWDLCHYGWPDWLDVWSEEFVLRFAELAHAFVHFLRERSAEPIVLTPVNEISFFSWAAGEQGIFYPYAKRRGGELKRQLVRAALAAIDAAWAADRSVRVVHTDPVINVIPHPRRPQDRERAAQYTQAQYEAMDMLAGRAAPELGGDPRYVDLVGLNYYHDNQWYYALGRKLPRDHPDYKPLHVLLLAWAERYGRPLLLAETGIEGSLRPGWLRWVCEEVRALRAEGGDLLGLCLYPIVNHPGWTNDRHCHNGLWDYADPAGERPIYEPLAKELRRQMKRFAAGDLVARPGARGAR